MSISTRALDSDHVRRARPSCEFGLRRLHGALRRATSSRPTCGATSTPISAERTVTISATATTSIAHWKVTASYSDSFRAPSFDDLYYPFSGNPSIQPERSHSIEAALQYASDALGVMRLTAFQTRYSNLIDYVAGDARLLSSRRTSGVRRCRGIEGSWAGMSARRMCARRSRSRIPSTETNHGSDAPRAPLRVVHRESHHRRLARGRRVDRERRARATSGRTLGGYGVVNLSARYNITKAWYVAAQIQNLFDKDYELAYSYNTPRRGAYVTLGWQQQ